MPDISESCRVCLAEKSEDFQSLFSQDSSEEPLSELGQLYEQLFQLSVDQNENTPRLICKSCLLQLRLFSEFKSRALRSYTTFKNIFTEIKDEIVIIESKDDSETVIVEENEEYFPEYSYISEEYPDVIYLEANEETTETRSESESAHEEENVHEDLESQEDILNDDPKTLLEDVFEAVEEVFCKMCKTTFPDEESLFIHKRLEHRRKKIVCTECGKTFLSEETLNAHKKTHSGLPAYKCEECGKGFEKRDIFQVHITRHKNERNVQCHLCGKKFQNRTDFRIHMRVHNDERRYECDICKKRFRAHTHMTDHRYRHFGIRLECDICHQSYSSPNTLRTHKKSIHSNACPYVCDICPKRFRRKHHLKIHQQAHFKKGEVTVVKEEEVYDTCDS